MSKRTVEVTILVEVEMDDTKFDETFMREFRESFFKFYTLEEHAEHIAQLEARELLDEKFTEGYGPLKDFGIKARVTDWHQETILTEPSDV